MFLARRISPKVALALGLAAGLPILLGAGVGAAPGDSDDPSLRDTSLRTYSSRSSRFDGFAIGAPHDGFDGYTGRIVYDMGSTLGAGRVRAYGFRSPWNGLYINVNQPTEGPLAGRYKDETRTRRADRVYERYQSALHKVARTSGALDLLIEIHGNSRKETIRGRRRHLTVIECATTGFSRSELRSLHNTWQAEARKRDLPPLYFEGLPEHETYSYEGERIRFYFRASSAKERGSLRSSKARRTLHFELPREVRYSSSKRAAVTRALTELAREAWDMSQIKGGSSNSTGSSSSGSSSSKRTATRSYPWWYYYYFS